MASKFLKVRCEGCKNEQIICGKSSNEVKCLICAKVLSSPKGGQANVEAKIVDILE